MRVFGAFVIGLILNISVEGQERPSLYPSPDNPYLYDFLFPERALAGFSAESGDALGGLTRSYYSNFVIPFFDSLGEAAVREEYIRGVLSSWAPELQSKIFPKAFDADALAKNYSRPDQLSPQEKAALSSIVSLEAINELRLPETAEEMELFRAFIRAVEKDATLVFALLQIDPLYLMEKLEDLERWRESATHAQKLPAALRNTNPEQISYRDLAEAVVWMAEQERSVPNAWGSVFGSLDLVKLLLERDSWGSMTEEERKNISENSWFAVEEKYAERAESEWERGLWNPLRDDASLTRAPALLATGLALRHMTRWLNVKTGFPRSPDLYFRQMEAASRLPRETLEKWVKDPSKSLTPRHLRRAHPELFKRPDFRESFRGARAQHLQGIQLNRLAIRAFGAEANTKPVEQFLSNEVYSKGVDQQSKMNAICAVELAHIEEGGMKAMAARRLLQRRLADASSFRGYHTSLKTRIRQFIQEEYGVAPDIRNYFPLRLRRHWIPIGRNPVRQFAQGVQNVSPRYRNSIFNFVPNLRIPAGSNFRSVWPLEFSPSSVTAAFARRLGTAAVWGSAASVLTDGLLYLQHETSDPYNVNTKDEEDKLLQEVLSELEGQLQLQSWSVQELHIEMKALELKFSSQRREGAGEGTGRPYPVKIFVDPRSAGSPEKMTARVPVVYAIAVPIAKDGTIAFEYLDQALLIRFDSHWIPESEEKIEDLKKAAWKISYVLDFSKAPEKLRQDFRSNLGIDPAGSLWIDPKTAGALYFEATPEMFLYKENVTTSR